MLSRRLTALAAALLVPLLCSAADRTHARSMVIHKGGIAATSHHLASSAGAAVLARGGSAVDAAIAANAVLGVTEPMMCGIGGDVFVLYWEAKTGKLWGLNGSGWAPIEMTPEFIDRQRDKEDDDEARESMPSRGILSATVPGAVRGWEAAHAKFGKLPWRDLFQASIRHADEGFPVTEIVAASWEGDILDVDPASDELFRPGGEAPQVGEVFRNPDLAKAMRLIAEQGADAFYRGEIAQAIVATSERLGGAFQAEDLADWKPEWVEPIRAEYRDWTIFELPPNGQGLAALTMLNLMEQTPASPFGPHSTPELHKKMEAMKLAYADIYAYIADPSFEDVPVEALLSKAYAKKRAAEIDLDEAKCDVEAGEPEIKDTTYLAVVDSEGNVASWIQSVSGAWGSGIVVDGMGFHLQNRGAGFKLDPEHPNRLEPRKRPFHTIIPGFMRQGDRSIGFGIMSGSNQPQAHAQFVSNVADYDLNLQEAMEAPRFRVSSPSSCSVSIESRIRQDVLVDLDALGHRLRLLGAHSTRMGRGNAVMHDSSTGVNFAASDSRADGSAIPEPLD